MKYRNELLPSAIREALTDAEDLCDLRTAKAARNGAKAIPLAEVESRLNRKSSRRRK